MARTGDVIDVAGVLRAPGPAPASPDARPPTMSVLVPAYNAAATIGEALESLVSQPEVDEIIVSDDGSEDELDAVLTPFQSRIRVVRGPNAGLATARNRAADVAEGALLALLDADDVWLPGRAFALKEAARLRPDLDIVTTDAVVVRGGEPGDRTYYERRGWPAGDQVDAIVRNNFIFGAAAIRREPFLAVGGYDPGARFAEDWDLWLRMLAAGSRAGLVDVPLYEYRRHPGSLTHQRLSLALAIVAMLDRARSLPLTTAQQRQLALTRADWRRRAALAGIESGDSRRWGLVARAVTGRHLTPRDRVAVVVQALTARDHAENPEDS